MNIIIPGGGGFVGRNLIRVLKFEDFNMSEITVLDRNDRGLEYVRRFGIRALKVDLAEKGDWHREFVGKELVINLAAQISSLDYETFRRNNVQVVENVLDSAKECDVNRIIHFSSAATLSVRKDFYARTKLEGEGLVKNSGLEYCILQPSIMYGPTDNKNIGFLIDFAKRYPFFPIPGHGRWPRQPIYVDDVCHLVASIVKDFPRNEVLSINGKEVIYFGEMVRIVLSQLDGLRFRVFLPAALFKLLMMSYQKLNGQTQFTTDQVDSLTAAEVFSGYPWWEEFGIIPTSFEFGVSKMLEMSEADSS